MNLQFQAWEHMRVSAWSTVKLAIGHVTFVVGAVKVRAVPELRKVDHGLQGKVFPFVTDRQMIVTLGGPDVIPSDDS